MKTLPKVVFALLIVFISIVIILGLTSCVNNQSSNSNNSQDIMKTPLALFFMIQN